MYNQNVGQLSPEEASKIFAKSSGLMIGGLVIGFYLIYKLLIQR